MITNFFKITLRRFSKNKISFLINIVGFAIGMSCVIIIALWIYDEQNYDTFNKNKKSIYRVTTFYDKYKWEGLALTPAPLTPVAKNQVPELTNATRLFSCPPVTMQSGEKIFNEQNGIFADPSFLDIFSYPLIYGSSETIFQNDYSIILTQKLAYKYFNNENPVGKQVIVDGDLLTIDGVLKDIPHNSHLQFDFIVPFNLIGQPLWGNMSFQTYVQLSKETDPIVVADKLTSLANTNCPQIQQGAIFQLQPLKKIHLDGNNEFNYTDTGNIDNVFLFATIACLILFIACFNFINLTTIQSEIRNKEIGIRKVNGANRKQLKYQFLIESILLTFVAICIAFGLSKLLLPYFNQISDKQLVLDFSDFRVMISLFVITVGTGIIAGFYPALYLASRNPLSALKDAFFSPAQKKSNQLLTRKILVVMQFTFSLALITSTLLIYNQIKYIQNKDLGFNKEKIIFIPLKNQIASHYQTFKNELLKLSNIQSVTAQDYLIASTNNRTTNYDWENKEEGESIDMIVSQVDYDFFETLDLPVMRGRSFSFNFNTDKETGFILNEEAIAKMDIENPIGKYFSYNDKRGQIIGVVKNANLESLHRKINPHVFHLINDPASITNNGIALIKLNGVEIPGTLKSIESVFKDLCNDAPFEYYFLDKVFDNLYKSEQRTGKIVVCFTVLAILISCLGLFGLARFSAQRRTKEIGIRKVNGAKVSEILALLNKDFVKWVAIAFVIATPIAWYAMNKWLENFAYKTKLSWWIFAMAGLLALGIALLTVSWQSWRAATRNPVEALRYE
ncbi:MAG: ABC transporter permease [Bacteroidales bacterium]|nr:ABC transporter permease [Bacteroidales bacterium]